MDQIAASQASGDAQRGDGWEAAKAKAAEEEAKANERRSTLRQRLQAAAERRTHVQRMARRWRQSGRGGKGRKVGGGGWWMQRERQLVCRHFRIWI